MSVADEIRACILRRSTDGRYPQLIPTAEAMERWASEVEGMIERVLRLEDIVRAYRKDALDRLAELSEDVGGYDPR